MWTPQWNITSIPIVTAFAVLSVVGCLGANEAEPEGVFEGQPVWEFLTPETLIASPVVSAEGIVFIRTTSAVYALDRQTGTALWEISAPGTWKATAPPAVFQDTLVVPEDDGAVAVYLFSRKSVQLLWRHCPGCATGVVYQYVQAMTESQGILFATRYDYRLTAYDLQAGAIEWEQPLSARSYSHVGTDGSALYVGTSGHIVAYNVFSGNRLWSIRLGDFVGRFAIKDEVLYALARRQGNVSLIALDTRLQQILWETAIPNSQTTTSIYLSVSDETVYTATDSLIAFDVRTGSGLWEFTGQSAFERPVLYGDKVFVRERGSSLYGLDAESGQQLDYFSLQNEAPRSSQTELNSVATGNLLIVPVGEELIYVYRLE